MKKYPLILSLLLLTGSASAQTAVDLLKYAQRGNAYGTARAMGMADAFGSLGGDMTAVGINPAGLGVFRKSTIDLSPSLSVVNEKTLYGPNLSTTRSVKGHIPSFGAVGCVSFDGALRSLNFGATYNRQANFRQHLEGNSFNRPISLMDNVAVGNDLHQYLYEAWLMDENGVSILQEGEKVNNDMKVKEKGYSGTWDFSIGFNIIDRVYLGASLSLNSMDITSETTYSESFELGGSMRLYNYRNTSGHAVQGKFGIIARPVSFLRLGVSYHTPSYFTASEIYLTELNSYGMVDDEGNTWDYTITSEDGQYAETNYHFQTPSTLVVSAAFHTGDWGVVSVDYESNNYKGLKMFDNNGKKFADVEQESRQRFRNMNTLRAGMEVRLLEVLYLRAGFSWSDSPIKSEVYRNNVKMNTVDLVPHYELPLEKYSICGGIGAHLGLFYIDFAVASQHQQYRYLPYSNSVTDASGYAYDNAASVNRRMLDVTSTIGLRF